MKKISILLVSMFCLAAGTVKAQDYQTAIGAKFYLGDGTLGGFNIKHSLAEKSAIEGSLLFASGAVGLEGLYEFQGPIPGAAGLQYFVGGGGLLAFGTGGGSTSFGLRLTGGAEYTFSGAPINISLGLDPTFYLAPSTGTNLALGLGIRYVLR
ncbi:MAG TPA: hypothetical protein PLM81_03820 [Ginsengibacter sp.]|nr:hypothetical protein [Chitinophagaceae bacterium]HRN72231.1 hypothetical protein [Ginsengibacter sp.]HRP17434.1 hypothetical protein [Ginsengibacter sp.]HRP44890.1 hypothetical protein [Ginsengibacter sp.]